MCEKTLHHPIRLCHERDANANRHQMPILQSGKDQRVGKARVGEAASFMDRALERLVSMSANLPNVNTCLPVVPRLGPYPAETAPPLQNGAIQGIMMTEERKQARCSPLGDGVINCLSPTRGDAAQLRRGTRALFQADGVTFKVHCRLRQARHRMTAKRLGSISWEKPVYLYMHVYL